MFAAPGAGAANPAAVGGLPTYSSESEAEGEKNNNFALKYEAKR